MFRRNVQVRSIFTGMKQYDPQFLATNTRVRRIEALKLYREVLRTCRMFTWSDENGRPWGLTIKNSARTEFEMSKQEKDPYVLAQSLINARMALDELQERYKKKQEQVNDNSSPNPGAPTSSPLNKTSSTAAEPQIGTPINIDPSNFTPYPGFEKK
ncbi:hypothetical protein AKO1_009927 [Acrasis kona]|uniref:Complex 1 LYR protein domain-containing protein n=1 Tax=Acrasis kona TaxID=1008807 RepID=A0AAW2ZQS3_9EUKA